MTAALDIDYNGFRKDNNAHCILRSVSGLGHSASVVTTTTTIRMKRDVRNIECASTLVNTIYGSSYPEKP